MRSFGIRVEGETETALASPNRAPEGQELRALLRGGARRARPTDAPAAARRSRAPLAAAEARGREARTSGGRFAAPSGRAASRSSGLGGSVAATGAGSSSCSTSPDRWTPIPGRSSCSPTQRSLGPPVEAFCFGTRLTRVTRSLAAADPTRPGASRCRGRRLGRRHAHRRIAQGLPRRARSRRARARRSRLHLLRRARGRRSRAPRRPDGAPRAPRLPRGLAQPAAGGSQATSRSRAG